MIECSWIIDEYILNNSYHERLDNVLDRNNIEYSVERYIPFQKQPSNFPFKNTGRPVIIYGSVEFVNWYCNNYYMTNPYIPGCFYDKNSFRTSYYMSVLYDSLRSNCEDPIMIENESSYFANADGIFVPFGMFRVNNNHYFDLFDTNKLFIRPDTGSKSFSGTTILWDDAEHEINSLCNLSNIMDHELIMVSSCKDIIDEYRYFIINNQVISSSHYMHKEKVCMTDNTDDDCNALAEIVAQNEKQIDLAYVCDIGKMNDGSCKIVELNSICSSGFYSANIDDIVLSMSLCADKEYYGEISKQPF